MPAIARSEPFREQACPVGACDGSGWILGPEDVARPCECRGERLSKGRSRGIASAIPARYRGVSFERPPVSDMARDLQTKAAGGHSWVVVNETSVEVYRGIWLKISPQLRTSGAAPGASDLRRLAFAVDLLPRTHWNVNVSYYRDRAFTVSTSALLVQLHLSI